MNIGVGPPVDIERSIQLATAVLDQSPIAS